MRLLFYGGCHAPALSRIFTASAVGAHTFAALENYVLIDRNEPFPYDRLPQFDAVVFSPIRNKDLWNTSHLEARCRQLGIRTVSYPWLQWNGYFSNVCRPERIAPHVWGLQGLMDLLKAGASVAELRKEARDGTRFSEAAKPYADYSFEALRGHEADCDVQIAGFIEQNFRRARLFATPDHPAAELYRFVCGEIASRLGLALNLPADLAGPHRDIFPILPAIAQALDLRFESTDYAIEHPVVGPLSLDQYLERLRADYVAANGEPAPSRPVAEQQSHSTNPVAANLESVLRDAPALLHVVHVLEFGGAFKVPVATTLEACEKAVAEARGGQHHAVSVTSEGYPFSLSPRDAAELLRRWTP